jgi:hypothetical protein
VRGKSCHQGVDGFIGFWVHSYFGGGSEMTHPTRVEEESPNASVVATRCIDKDLPDFSTSSLLVKKKTK